MGWRGGRPVDAATAPAEKAMRSGKVILQSSEPIIAAPGDLICRSIGFLPDSSNIGAVYIGSYVDVADGSGFPVPTTGIAFDVNQEKLSVYGIADTSGDIVRWISIL